MKIKIPQSKLISKTSGLHVNQERKSPQFVSLSWNAKWQSARRAVITVILKWQRRAGKQETAVPRTPCGKKHSLRTNWNYLHREAVSDFADVNILRGTASCELLKWLLLHSDCQKSPDRSVRGKCSSGVHVHISTGEFKTQTSSSQRVKFFSSSRLV